MQFVVANSVGVTYVIPPLRAHQSDPQKYHLEVRNHLTDAELIVNNPTVVPATAPSGSGSGTPGSVTFTGVPITEPGMYSFKLMYANQVDLDGNVVSMTLLNLDTVYKIVPSTVIEL